MDLKKMRDEIQKYVSLYISGREEEVDAILLSLFTHNHLIIIGKPGTAKTMLVKVISELFNLNVFSYQLTKFTEYSEIFGALNLKKYREGEIERISRIQNADIVFLDEILKGNSAILNSLLSLLRERKIFDGYKTYECNLITCIGTTNEELYENKEYWAFIDRFVIKKYIKPLEIEEIKNAIGLVYSENKKEVSSFQINRKDIEEANNFIHSKTKEKVKKEAFLKRIENLIKSIKKEAFISDRTAIQLPKLLTSMEEMMEEQEKDIDMLIISWMFPKESQRIMYHLMDENVKKIINLMDEILKQSRKRESLLDTLKQVKELMSDIKENSISKVEKSILKNLEQQIKAFEVY